jgi:MFS family permease
VLGFYAAGWTAIVGEASEGRGRGTFLGSYARLISAGALGALLLTSAITFYYPSYTVLYIASGALFLLSALVLRGTREQEVKKSEITTVGASKLKRFYVLTGIYGFFWGFAWPLFTITVVKIVGMSLFEYSVSQVIAVGATIAFQPLVGRLVDRDRRGWVFWGRMALVVYPLAYMFFGAAWEVYVINVFSGFTTAIFNVAFVAYLYDISPAGHRGRYNAEFNLVTGVSTMAGSLLAALALTLISTPDTLWVSLAYLYIIAAVGRGVAALLHLRLPLEGHQGTVEQGFYR